MSLRDYFLAALATVLFGVNYAVIKVAVGYVPPLFVTALRFVFVAAVLLWFFPMPKGMWKPVIVVSVVQGLFHHGSMFIGMGGVDAAIGAIITQLGTPFAALFAWLLLGEKFGWYRTFGVVVAFVGVALLAGQPDIWEANYYVLLLVFCSLSWGYVNVYIKSIGPVNILQLTAWFSVFAAPQLFIASYVLEQGQVEALLASPYYIWGLLGYMGICATGLAYGIWYSLLARYDVAQIVPFALLTPVLGALSGIILLGEEMTLEKIVGGAIVLVGVAIIQLRAKRAVIPAD
ncbi:MAG: DMT family transporter [Rhodospirillales bacterium]|nr:DMT family transporter [Rhodospirillales bacterium]